MANVKVFDGLAIQHQGDCILAVWNAPARVERGRPFYDEAERYVAASPGGVLWLQVVLESSSGPDGPMREENHVRLRRWGPSLRRLVTVPVGSPVWSMVVGTIMRSIFVVTGQSGTQRVARTEREGIEVLLKNASPLTPPRAALEAGIDDLYKSLGVARRA